MRYLRALVNALIIVLVFVLAAGCGDDSSPPEHSGDQEAIAADEVRVLDESARQSLNEFDFDLDANKGTLRFDADSAFASEIEEGRILASRPAGDVAPSGLLQRVTAVERQGDAIVVTTRQATLAETFEQADFEAQRVLGGSAVETAQPLKQGVTIEKHETREMGVRQREQAIDKALDLNFDKVVVDTDGDRSTTNDQLKLNGEVSFGARFDTALKVRQFKLRRFLFAVNVEESVDLEVTGDFNQADIDKQTQVAQINLNTIVFQVGPVPVVIKIDLVVSIGVDGTVTAEVRASASQSASVRLGGEYTDDNGWRGINENSSSFEVPPPEFSFSSVNVRGYVRPQVEVKLYGVAGPFVFAEPYVRFDAEVYRSPFWRLHGGLNFGVGFVVRVPVLDNVASWEASIPAFEEPIASSSNRPPTLELVSPEDGGTATAGSNLELTVTARDREQRAVEVAVNGEGMQEITNTVFDGGEADLILPDLCEGPQSFTIVARDDQGATDTLNFSTTVENVTPTVSLDDSTLRLADSSSDSQNAPPVFPGAYFSAAARVDDRRCQSADSVNVDLIEWYIDGNRVARAPELFKRLSPTTYSAGDTISLQARFDDGKSVGQSQAIDITLEPVPAGDLDISVNITQCSVCANNVFLAGNTYVPNEITLRGTAFDPKEGELSGSELTWEIQNESSNSRTLLGTGNSVTFKMSEVFLNPGNASGENTIYLTVDDGGQTYTATETFLMIIGT